MSVNEITTPPVLVDSDAFNFYDSSIGPVKVASDLYVALQSFSGLAQRLQVLKSTDGGATWARLDDGSGSSFVTNGSVALFLSTGIFFLFGGVDPINTADSTKVDEQSFPYSSETFQSLVTAAITAYQGRLRGVLRSDDTAVATFRDNGDINGVIFSGGSLGTPFSVDTGAITDNVCLIIDSSDVAHALFNIGGTVFYRTITGAGSVSGSVSIPDVPEQLAAGLADSGNLYYPWADFSGPFGRAQVEVATGATSNPATASWTQYQVWTSGLDADSNDDSPVMMMDGADPVVFWINETDAGISRIYSARFNGSGFDAPVLFYDSSLYPPTGATVDPTITRIAIANIGGAFVVILTMAIDGTGVHTYYGVSTSGPTSGNTSYVY